MSVSDDVGNLFRRFGGDAGQYQEVTRDDDAKHAALRWPLLNALDIAHTEPVPDAGRPVSPPASLAARVEPAVQASHAPPAQPAAVSETTSPARAPLFARGHRHASMPPPVAPAQIGASRFSASPTVVPAADRTNAAANAPTLSAASTAPVAETPKSVAPAPAVAPAQSAPAASPEAVQQRAEPPPAQAAQFLAEKQTFARAPFNSPVAEGQRAAPSAATQQQGGSILSGLFSDRDTPRQEVSAAPSKDLSSVFARLSRGSAAPARSLRDSFRSRFKADGDA